MGKNVVSRDNKWNTYTNLQQQNERCEASLGWLPEAMGWWKSQKVDGKLQYMV